MLDLVRKLNPNGPLFPDSLAGVVGDMGRHAWLAAAVRDAAPCDRPMRVLEIGSWLGNSALSIAAALRRHAPQGGSVLCIDAWAPYNDREAERGGVYRAMDELAGSDLAYALFRHNAGFAPEGVRIDHFRGRSADVLPYLSGPFDLVYVDGSHRYSDVLGDLRQAVRLTAPEGILCGDDLELPYGAVDPEVCGPAREDDVAVDPASGLEFHPGVALAVHEVLGDIRPHCGFWGARRSGDGWRTWRPDLVGTEPPAHFTAAQRARFVIPSGRVAAWPTLEPAENWLIYGTGMAGRRALMQARRHDRAPAAFLDREAGPAVDGIPVLPLSAVDAETRPLVVIAGQHWREMMVAVPPGCRIAVAGQPAGDTLFLLPAGGSGSAV